MSAPYTKNHIVPQSYLFRFAEANKDEHYIGTVLKATKKLFPAQVHDVGQRKNFYSSTNKSDIKYWEKYIGYSFDSLYGDPLSSIINKIESENSNAPVLDDDHKLILSKLVLSQAVRAFSAIDSTVAMKKRVLSLMSSLAKMSTEIDDQALKEEYLDGIFREKDFNSRCEILRTRIWRILINENYSSIPFVTSDNPVLLFNNATNKSGFLENIGLDDDTIVYLPVTPKILIENYSGFLNNSNIQQMALAYVEDGLCYSLQGQNESIVIQINRLLWKNADKQVFIPEPLFRKMKNNPRIIETLFPE